MNGVSLAVETLARACCEASAQVLWTLEADASREERPARAYNYVVATLPPGAAARKNMQAQLISEAQRLNISVTEERRGRVFFGERPLSRGALFRRYLDPVIGGEAVASSSGRLWHRWSGSTHVDAQAGFMALLATRKDGNDTAAPVIKGAAVAAAGAHMTAVHRVLQHSGQLDEPQIRRALEAAMAELLLTFIPLSTGARL